MTHRTLAAEYQWSQVVEALVAGDFSQAERLGTHLEAILDTLDEEFDASVMSATRHR